MPHARTWFGDDGHPAKVVSTSRRRTNIPDDENSDDDIVVSRATINLKCPLTLQYFEEPFTSKTCRHTFEKSAFLEYFNMNAKYHNQILDRRGRPVGPQGEKEAECPQAGCQKVGSQILEFLVFDLSK